MPGVPEKAPPSEKKRDRCRLTSTNCSFMQFPRGHPLASVILLALLVISIDAGRVLVWVARKPP
jgi:hypothetical protein